MMNKLRLYSGLILFLFVTGHLINLSMGLISIDAMVEGAKIFLNPWHSIFGRFLLTGSFLIHISIALWSIWNRRTLKMSMNERVQIILGLLAPLILFGHVFATKFIDGAENITPTYYTTISFLWVTFPWRGIIQAGAVLVVWSHGCIGINKWLQSYATFERFKLLGLFLAGGIPTIALAGYVAAGNRVLEAAGKENWIHNLYAGANLEPWVIELANTRELIFQIGFVAFLLILFVGRHVRSLLGARIVKPKISYFPGGKIIELIPNSTLLESIRAAEIPHAAVCGGHGRCSTCRVRIGKGASDLPPPTEQEINVLSAAALSFSVRLACQLRPTKNLEVTALLKPDGVQRRRRVNNKNLPAKEMDVVILFVDIRNSTALSEERLPFDVVYILNLFFAEMADALQETNGHYAQFNGDGLMAIYGLESGPIQGCKESIEGAKAMFFKLAQLNERLSSELPAGLKIGIGIHAGEAVVGSMGPPEAPIISALGDNVNVAAWLESLTKEYDVPLIISTTVAEHSGLRADKFPTHSVMVKGRNRMVDINMISEPHLLTTHKPKRYKSSVTNQSQCVTLGQAL